MSERHESRCVPWDTREASGNSVYGLARMLAAQGHNDDSIVRSLWASEHLRLDAESRHDQGVVGRAVQLARTWAYTLSQVVDQDGYMTDVPSERSFLPLPLQSQYMYTLTADLIDTTTEQQQRISRTLVLYSDQLLDIVQLISRARDEGMRLSQRCNYFGDSSDWLAARFVPLLFARRQ